MVDFTPEQTELESTISRFLSENFPVEKIRARINNHSEHDSQFWQKSIELGLLECFADDANGGFNLGAIELGILSRNCGTFLTSIPIWERVLCGPWLLNLLPPSMTTELAKLASGELVAGVAFCLDNNDDVKTANLLPTKMVVSAPTLNHLLVFRKDGAYFTRNNCYNWQHTPLLDLSRGYFSTNILLSDLEGLPQESGDVIKKLLILSAACEIEGIASKVVNMTVEYVKIRKQFDVPIGSFQTIQQKLAEMYVASESLSALTKFACWSVDKSPSQSAISIKAAWLRAKQIGITVIEDAIQLHGGIGFTWEHDLHLYLRRSRTILAIWGELFKTLPSILEDT